MATDPIRYVCPDWSEADDPCVREFGHLGPHRAVAPDGSVYEFARDRWAVAMDDDLPDEEADSDDSE